MDERRYDEAEVRRIFDLATRVPAPHRPPDSAKGLTLSDVQDIGSEVGVDPGAIARAAAALETAAARQPRTSLGMPIEVGRTVPLARAPTDREWEQIVAELRSTFRAKGRVTRQGDLREWSNGNLHACVEPAARGYRLRLGTLKGNAPGVNALGATGMAAGAVLFASMVLSGEVQGAIILPTLLGASGVAAFLTNLLRLPRWAEQRTKQMEHIARLAESIVHPANTALPTGEGESAPPET
jgi:hypothetical protein